MFLRKTVRFYQVAQAMFTGYMRYYRHNFFPPGATQPIMGVYFTALYRALASSRARLLDHIQRRATVGKTPLNE